MGHDWYEIPSKWIARRWCKRCGVFADAKMKGFFKPYAYDWTYVTPGTPFTMSKEEPPCRKGIEHGYI